MAAGGALGARMLGHQLCAVGQWGERLLRACGGNEQQQRVEAGELRRQGLRSDPGKTWPARIREQ